MFPCSVPAVAEATAPRKAEIELQKLGDGGVSSVPRVQAGSGLILDGKVDKTSRKRARRNTFDVSSHVPLFLKMNALVLREVKSMGFDEREKGLGLKRGTPKHSMANCKTFGGMCTEGVRKCMTERIVEEDADDRKVVGQFYGLFTGREERVRTLVKAAAKQPGLGCKWSHWFCFTCDKVQCTCEEG